MAWLKKAYKKNIYGVMGTLVFHILLISLFLLADIDMKGKMKEEPIIIEFPDILPEPEEIIDDQQENLAESEQGSAELITNRASNISAQVEDNFFDEDYKNQLSESQKLVADVNNQLNKQIIKIEDVEMPVDNTHDMDPDSIRNIIYTGKSNIIYVLENRYHISLPIPVYLAQGGGEVVVDIVVDRRGNVVKTNSRNNRSISDPQVFYYAELAAGRTTFNSDPTAPTQQRGTITYLFIAQ
ncbi:MAG: hypothetical protein HQ541_06955 [Mariniphaga sp.]|nr:hypothetical protein [Mariniphaga sp.]